jgi:O-antigen ligase
MSVPKPDYAHRALVVFFTLFVFASTFTISLSQTSLGVALLIFISLAFRDHFQPFIGRIKWVYIAIGLYLCWLWLSALVGETPIASLAITKEEWLFSIILIGAYLLRSEAMRMRMITALAIGVGLFSAYGIVQYVTGVSWLEFSAGRLKPVAAIDVDGTFSNALTYANYYVTAACFLLGLGLAGGRPWGPRRWLQIVTGVLALTAVVLTMRRGAILAGLVTLALFALIRRAGARWAVVGLVIGLLAVLLMVPQYRDRFGTQTFADQSSEYQGSRLYIWRHSLEIVGEHPVFGVGQGNFRYAYAAKLPPETSDNRKLTHAHNDLLNLAAVAGIPGALFFAGIWLAVLYYLWRGYRNQSWSDRNQAICLGSFLGSIAFLLSSMTEATFADEEVRQLLMFIWAIGLAGWYNETSKVELSKPNNWS